MDSIQIMGRTVRIERAELIKDGEGSHGEFHGDKNLIRLNIGMDKETERAALVHECFHAILHYSGLTWVINNEDLEEAIARALEYNFLDTVDRIEK